MKLLIFGHVIQFVLFSIDLALSDETVVYNIPNDEMCNSFKKWKGDAFVLKAYYTDNFARADCDIEFHADEGLDHSPRRLMMKIFNLTITNCNVRLVIFDYMNARKKTIMCNHTGSDIILPDASTRLLLEGANKKGYNFNVHITRFEKTSSCSEFLCENKYCISDDLVCDGFDNCLDGSDERDCEEDESSVLVGWIIGILVVLILLVIVIVAIFTIMRRKKMENMQRNQYSAVYTGQTPQQAQTVYQPTTEPLVTSQQQPTEYPSSMRS